ncbi:DoxX family protein [Burkholderia sp. BCC1993]|uniref:DoxX family protein n=1 Tax=Burkholderia sp. BCC1993 TaxID=2817444 RepID=UPI002AB29DC8|nr:DoxX family protein [Burkholderia sp. BCC1993]
MEQGNSNVTSALPLVGRVLIALLFLISGLGKLAAPGATIGYISSLGLPLPLLGFVGALVLELAGGVLLVVGYRVRVAAALLAVYSVVTALIFHHALGDQNQFFHFFKDVAIAGGLLQIVAHGAGAFSLDRRVARAHGKLGASR